MLPRTIRRPLLGVATLLQPLLSPTMLSDRQVDEEKLQAYTCVARPDIVRARIVAPAAVYVVWDGHGTCPYVGSVSRTRGDAVAVRLYEHLNDKVHGEIRSASWLLLSVLPLRAGAPTSVVRAAEGWAARNLAPYEGSRQPSVEFHLPPRLLARRLS
ncbi:hypothetical protein ABZ729_08060 [Streptomyces sp. NPDC006678]|uniref:hypothetical protein n=1 Tax=Streptomyces sp. NPDC006678 TaxID=3157185 RepID=UPI0033D4EC9E